MGEEQAELGVADLIEGAEDRHRPPLGRQAEPGHAQLAQGGGVLDDGHAAEVRLGH